MVAKTTITGKIATQPVPLNIERCLKKERRENRGENEILGQVDFGRERKHCQNNSCRNQANAVGKAKTPSQHGDDRCNQKQ